MENTAANNSISAILAAQRKYFSSGATLSLGHRREALERLETALVDRQDAILEALSQDLGKPDLEAYLSEYHFLLQEIRLIRKSLKAWLKPVRVRSPFYFQPCKTELRYEPYGVTLVMAPWNYPIQLALSPLVAALAAGNTVVLKPSELATASERILVEIIRECFAPEYVSVLTGGPDVAGNLLEEKFDFLFFTGSTEIGKVVARKAAEHLTPVILELGGKCPCVVHSSAKLEVTAERLLVGKFFNAGQTCFAPDFVAVDASVRESLIDAMKAVMDRIPWSEEMASIVSVRHYERLRALLHGAEMVDGKDDPQSLQMAPRVLPEAQWDDAIMKEEVFGPILPVVEYQDADELISRLRDYGSPLALYLFCEDDDFNQRIMSSIQSGGVCINDTMKQGAMLNAPFGGVGESGHGRYRGRFGVESMSYQRTIVSRPSWMPDFFAMLPPYGDKFNWIKRFLR